MTTKLIQMEYQFTAAGQLSLFKWNIRLQLHDNQAYSNGTSGYSYMTTKLIQMEYQFTAAGQLSLFKCNIRLQLHANQAYSNGISVYSCRTTKLIQVKSQVTAAGQPSLFKWKIILQLQDNQAYSNEISGYSCITTKFTQMEYQVTCIFPTFYQLNFNDWPQSGKCGLCGKVLKKGMGVNGKNTKEKTLNFLKCLYSLLLTDLLTVHLKTMWSPKKSSYCHGLLFIFCYLSVLVWPSLESLI